MDQMQTFAVGLLRERLDEHAKISNFTHAAVIETERRRVAGSGHLALRASHPAEPRAQAPATQDQSDYPRDGGFEALAVWQFGRRSEKFDLAQRSLLGKRAYYAAIPAAPGDIVTVRLYEHDVEIFDRGGTLLRRHPRSFVPGHFEMAESDRIFNPSRETVRLLNKAAKLGPESLELARIIFLRLGRPGQKALYGLTDLPLQYAKEDIEKAAKRVLSMSQPSYHALKRILERQAAEAEQRAAAADLQQSGPHIRELEEYHAFFENAQRFDDQTSETP